MPDFQPAHEGGAPFAFVEGHDLRRLSAGHCPRCDGRGFVIGPAAHGMGHQLLNLNIECASLSCRSRYNVAFRSGEALMAQDLFDGRAGPPWPSEPK